MDSNTITATFPAGLPAGPYDILVTNPDGEEAILRNGYTVTDPLPTTYTITATAGPHGSISPSGTVTVESGANQGFMINADAGYLIADVLVDGVSIGKEYSNEHPFGFVYIFFDVRDNHTIEASFVVAYDQAPENPPKSEIQVIPVTESENPQESEIEVIPVAEPQNPPQTETSPPTLPGNINTTLIDATSKRVDGYDLNAMEISFGAKPGDANWNPAADLNTSGVVDGEDLVILGANFGKQ